MYLSSARGPDHYRALLVVSVDGCASFFYALYCLWSGVAVVVMAYLYDRGCWSYCLEKAAAGGEAASVVGDFKYVRGKLIAV